MAVNPRERYSAPPPGPKYIPKFKVQKLDGVYEKTVAKMIPVSTGKIGRDGQPVVRHRLDYETVRAPKGFLVTFPKGHSIHIATVEELYAQGYGDPEVDLVEQDGGEVVGRVPNVVHKQKQKEPA